MNNHRAAIEPRISAIQQWAATAARAAPASLAPLAGPAPVFGTSEKPGVNAIVVGTDELAHLGEDYTPPVDLETDGACLRVAAVLLRRGELPPTVHWKPDAVESCANLLEHVRYALVLVVRDSNQAELVNRTTFRAGSYSAYAYLLDLQTQQPVGRFSVSGYNDSTVTTNWGGGGVRTNLWGHARESLRANAASAIPGVRFLN